MALIDLDGTLMHAAPDLAPAANRVRAGLGLPELGVERGSQFAGKGTDLLVHRAPTDDIHGRVDDGSLRNPKEAFERRYRDANGSYAGASGATFATILDAARGAIQTVRLAVSADKNAASTPRAGLP